MKLAKVLGRLHELAAYVPPEPSVFFAVYFKLHNGTRIAEVEVKPLINFVDRTTTFTVRIGFPTALTGLTLGEAKDIHLLMRRALDLGRSAGRVIEGKTWPIEEYLPLEKGVVT